MKSQALSRFYSFKYSLPPSLSLSLSLSPRPPPISLCLSLSSSPLSSFREQLRQQQRCEHCQQRQKDLQRPHRPAAPAPGPGRDGRRGLLPGRLAAVAAFQRTNLVLGKHLVGRRGVADLLKVLGGVLAYREFWLFGLGKGGRRRGRRRGAGEERKKEVKVEGKKGSVATSRMFDDRKKRAACFWRARASEIFLSRLPLSNRPCQPERIGLLYTPLQMKGEQRHAKNTQGGDEAHSSLKKNSNAMVSRSIN